MGTVGCAISGVAVWGVEAQIFPPCPAPARALTTRVLSLNAGMVVPRVAPVHQRQGSPGAPPAPPGGLQHFPDDCPHQAAPNVPAAYGHLTLTRTAPGPDSSGQGGSWGGTGAGDLPLSPALPAQGGSGGDALSTSRRGNSQMRGCRCRERSFGKPVEQPLPSSPCPLPGCVPMSPSCILCQPRSPCLCRACWEVGGTDASFVVGGILWEAGFYWCHCVGTWVPAGDPVPCVSPDPRALLTASPPAPSSRRQEQCGQRGQHRQHPQCR